jgi:Rrf2 family protein
MNLSKRGDYVIRSAIALARSLEDDAYLKIRELVTESKVPRSYAAEILNDLVRAELATSRAGRDGGYRLCRPASAISILEVIEAAEGPLRGDRCALAGGPCHWDAVCPLHETWSAATGALRNVLSKTTLAELVARDRQIEAGEYEVPADSHRGAKSRTSDSRRTAPPLRQPARSAATTRAKAPTTNGDR